MKGIYTLIIFLAEKTLIRTRKKDFIVPPGFCIYVGSAMGPYNESLEKRVLRHLRKHKRRFWHIDYLLNKKGVGIKAILYSPSTKKLECSLASRFEKRRSVWVPIEGFGCSDCKCRGHLFVALGKTTLESALKNTMKAHRTIGLSPRMMLIVREKSHFQLFP
jgi:Uri superfamily endonuclease